MADRNSKSSFLPIMLIVVVAADLVLAFVPLVECEACAGVGYLTNKEFASRRQLLPPAYIRNGSIYLVRRYTLMERNTFYGHTIIPFEMKIEESINIDNETDWEKAESLFSTMRGTQ